MGRILERPFWNITLWLTEKWFNRVWLTLDTNMYIPNPNPRPKSSFLIFPESCKSFLLRQMKNSTQRIPMCSWDGRTWIFFNHLYKCIARPLSCPMIPLLVLISWNGLFRTGGFYPSIARNCTSYYPLDQSGLGRKWQPASLVRLLFLFFYSAFSQTFLGSTFSSWFMIEVVRFLHS